MEIRRESPALTGVEKDDVGRSREAVTKPGQVLLRPGLRQGLVADHRVLMAGSARPDAESPDVALAPSGNADGVLGHVDDSHQSRRTRPRRLIPMGLGWPDLRNSHDTSARSQQGRRPEN